MGTKLSLLPFYTTRSSITMALQPSLNPLLVVGNPAAPHTLEFFLDFVCPFSRKSAVNGIDAVLKKNLLAAGGKYDGQVKVR